MKLFAVAVLSLGATCALAAPAAPLDADPPVSVTFYSCARPNTFSCFRDRNMPEYASTCAEPKETDDGSRVYDCGGLSLTLRITSDAVSSTRGHLFYTSGKGNIVSDCAFAPVEGEEHDQLVCTRHSE